MHVLVMSCDLCACLRSLMGLTRAFVTVVDPWVALAASSRGKKIILSAVLTPPGEIS